MDEQQRSGGNTMSEHKQDAPIAERWATRYHVWGKMHGHEVPTSVGRQLIEELSAAEGRERVLREALERTVWRERSQFPKNPFCVICGAGKEWAAIHGHETTCPLALAPEQPAEQGKEPQA